ncbi:hypothetical protein [Nocardia abscessus]|uniref:hypothetical protein n=1 Tax=Nocardia abscessus TaxID=120957 RepID=UPI002458A467|nr:hypothetical protein [Nocardia abscessus]
MYLDLLTNASLLDHTVWASPDTWNSALDLAAKKKKSSKGGLIIGAICCLLVVALIIGGVYLLTKRNNNNCGTHRRPGSREANRAVPRRDRPRHPHGDRHRRADSECRPEPDWSAPHEPTCIGDRSPECGLTGFKADRYR